MSNLVLLLEIPEEETLIRPNQTTTHRMTIGCKWAAQLSNMRNF